MADRKKRGLGKGLDALFPMELGADDANKKQPGEKKKATVKQTPEADTAVSETDSKKEEIVKIVRISSVERNSAQPRKQFDKEKLEELAESIKSRGLLEPIIVQDAKTHYEIIAGERRWRACKLAGLKEIPVIVKNYDDLEKIEVSLIENIQREQLNPIEEANAYRRLVDEFHLKQEELAQKVCKSRAAVANSMRLLRLTEKVQTLVTEGKLSMGHARALVAVEDTAMQEKIADETVEKNLSVREVEKLIKNLGKEKPAADKKKDESLELIYKDIASKMNSSLGMKVNIRQGSKKSGKIEITFANQEDLEKIMDRILS